MCWSLMVCAHSLHSRKKLEKHLTGDVRRLELELFFRYPISSFISLEVFGFRHA